MKANFQYFDRMHLRVVICALLLIFQGHLISNGQVLNEDRLKANYLLGFKDFVHWERSENIPCVIGVVGSDFVLEEIKQILADRERKNPNILFKVVEVHDISEIEKVDLLYFTGETRDVWEAYLQKACELSILTVANEPGFLQAGGLIRFEIRKNRLRFRLNPTAGQECGIQFSSKLMKLSLG